MNFLAHAYLSFDNQEILVGNMIGDFVKGKQKDAFPESIRKGIELHRFIDSFTDTHAIVKQAEKVFKPLVRLYSGAFTDVVFDYFLANDAKEKTEDEWKIFAQHSYQILEKHQQYFPEKFVRLFHYMKQENWLYNYRFTWEIQNSFNSVIRRAKYLSVDGNLILTAFQENIPFLKECYEAFFPELKDEVRKRIKFS